MADRLSHKEKGFVKDIVIGETGVKAALNNYDTKDYSTAGVIASENLKKPKIKKAIKEALPDEMLTEIHREGLFATRTVFKNNNATKKIEAVAEEADFPTRAKYLDMAYKVKGTYAPEKHVNLNVDIPPTDKVIKLAKKMNAK